MTNTTAVKRTTALSGTAVKELQPGDKFVIRNTRFTVVDRQPTRIGHVKGYTEVTAITEASGEPEKWVFDSFYRVHLVKH